MRKEVEPATCPVRLLSMAEVRAITGLSETAIRSGTGEGWFPAGRKLGPRTVRWLENEVVAAIEALPKVRYAPAQQMAA